MAHSASTLKLLLTPNEASSMLSISPRTLWALTQAGALPVVRIGRSTRYDQRDLVAYIDSQKCRATAESHLASRDIPALKSGASGGLPHGDAPSGTCPQRGGPD